MSKKSDSEFRFTSLSRVYRVFGRHLLKYWRILLVAHLGLLATVAIAVLTPWPLKLILDHLILNQPFPDTVGFMNAWQQSDARTLLLALSLAIVLIAVLEALFSYINKYLVSSTGERVNADIRERVFAHLQRLSLSFHESARTGNLVYLLTSDIKEMKALLIDFPQDLTQRVVTLAGYAGLMLVLDWRLGLIALSTAPAVHLFTKYFGTGMNRSARKMRKQEGEVASIIAENLDAMALVQAYGREESERERFRVENLQSLEAKLRTLRLHRTFSRITDFLATLSTAGVLYFGGRYALAGEVSPGTVVLFVAYMREIYGSFEKFSGLFLNLAKSLASGERLAELVENDTVVQEAPDAIPAPPLAGTIEFRNVSFAYPNGKQVLKNLNFRVAAGETVALVGPSGAGKSTLISLLLRFHDPQTGQVLIDGHDVRRFTLKSLRDQVTILLQEARLFQQTVRENIAFGRPGATEEEIIAAARLAEAHDFIKEMPQQYDTLMLEGGDNLSGGQKQRINIARAIIRNTPIMILDEPATGLDARAEAKISRAIHRLTQGKTAFIIAHKFSTILSADKILLLADGQIACMGTHEELLRNSPQYLELYELQLGRQTPAVASDGKSGNLATLGHTGLVA